MPDPVADICYMLVTAAYHAEDQIVTLIMARRVWAGNISAIHHCDESKVMEA
jgi:hypothetical protein